MYVELIAPHQQMIDINSLRFRVISEHPHDSPLHHLPQLTRLLALNHFNSYAIHWITNPYGRFDLEIISERPIVINGQSSMNLYKKVSRLYRLFYQKPLIAKETLDYEAFIFQLSRNINESWALDDFWLYQKPVRWYGFIETYHFLQNEANIENDRYYNYLKNTEAQWIAPPIGRSPCPFDTRIFLEQQVITGFKYFLLCVNYRPLGDSPFHLMLIPYDHAMDFMHMPPEALDELEILLRATRALWQNDRDKLRIYLQKHAQLGMTVAHMHIHIVYPSSKNPFKQDLTRQLRFFAAKLVGDQERAHALARSPLSEKQMKQQIWRYRKPIKINASIEQKVQHKHFVQLRSRRIFPKSVISYRKHF